jgi:NadR type nicotinamide-nucleotide adenylyltransferase
MNLIKKIVAIGPESTGKSTLCAQLAAHYNTSWCAEYAREYLLENGTNYTYENVLTIARGQIALEERVQQQTTGKYLFIDTDMNVIKVWTEFVFGKCEPWILNAIAQRKYDLYLLCNIDLPWVKDELREYACLDTRKQLYCYYKDLLINQSIPWVEISGQKEQRTQCAIGAINNLFPEFAKPLSPAIT